MKCAACGYDEALPFKKLLLFPAKEQFVFACPKCGTVRLEKPEAGEVYKNRFHGCKCPWCGNTHEEEFQISHTRKSFDPLGETMSYENFNMACSCGAVGPDADSEDKAIGKFRMWGNK